MINIKTKKEIQSMREGGKILATILGKLEKAVKPGITTRSLDELAAELILFHKVKPSFLGYGGFPAVLCTSVNNEVVHGVPSERVLKEGDILSLDFGVVHQGLHTDSAITMLVKNPSCATAEANGDTRSAKGYEWASKKTTKLIEVTRQALNAGIDAAQVGNRVGAIGHAVQTYVEKQGFAVVRDLVGHGIGEKLHEEPYVPNFGHPDEGPILKEGMTIAIEPMVTRGGWEVRLGDDGFVFLTTDNSLSAHFEHTVLITTDGPEILTPHPD